MSIHTIDSALHFPASIASRQDRGSLASTGRLCPDDGVRAAGGAIRGLAFALLFQGILSAIGFLGWEIVRRLL